MESSVCGHGTSEGYSTFPLGSFLSYAHNRASSVNPCFPLQSAIAESTADLSTGKLHVFAGAPPTPLADALADAYFSDDVNLYFAGLPVSLLPDGLSGEIRLDVHGHSTAGYSRAHLETKAFNGAPLGDVEYEYLKGGESLVLHFRTPFHFFALFHTVVGNGQVADFSNTGSLAISLPEGYSFTSASGVLLKTISVSANLKGLNVEVAWTGGTDPFRVQSRPSLNSGTWEDLVTTRSRSTSVPTGSIAGFIRVLGQ